MKKRKLPPHQYCLRLIVHHEPKIEKNLPHLVFYDGKWHLFRTKWKSQFRGPKLFAFCRTEATIPLIRRAYARYGLF